MSRPQPTNEQRLVAALEQILEDARDRSPGSLGRVEQCAREALVTHAARTA